MLMGLLGFLISKLELRYCSYGTTSRISKNNFLKNKCVFLSFGENKCNISWCHVYFKNTMAFANNYAT